MKTKHSVKLYLAFALLALALMSVGCATAPRYERYVPPPLGSTFTFSRSNTGSFGSGTEKATWTAAERTWEGKRMTALGIPGGVGLFNADGNQVAVLGPDDKPILSYDPPIGYDYPLEVGKTWAKSYRVTIYAANQTIPFDYSGKVEAYEDVTVPAGTFKAWRVSYSDSLGETQTVWSAPDKMGGFVKQIRQRAATYQPGGAGTREVELVSIDAMK